MASGTIVTGPAQAQETSDVEAGGMSPNQGIAPTVIRENERRAFEFFTAKGLTDRQAAGVVGNLRQESGVDPRAIQDPGPGRGIAQWSVGGRWDTDPTNLIAFANNRDKSRWGLNIQLKFIWHELNVNSRFGKSDLLSATTIREATEVFAEKYEVCGHCLTDQRVEYAKDAFDRYAGGGGGSGNPYTPGEVCGSGFKVINQHGLNGNGRVYLMYNGATGKNCVTTIKNTKIGKKSPTSAFLKVQNGTRGEDKGNFGYYAGPVKKYAAGQCVKWGGSVGDKSYASGFEHCG
ncbi:phage tail tip lysozyme [Prauserella alba]|uniref:Phage tail lysozyme domain-containing protein n=1 Tax=Prauserella alba TaxID=176898 RepID=A0ABN1VCM6_9PSEU|nr:phage tail tip lysozyme [Prauserella alba]